MHEATRPVLALLALTTCGCAATLPAVRPWPGPPAGSACRVVVERSEAKGGWPLEHHYAADGRALAGTTRLYSNAHGWERFLYDEAGRLRAIESHDERDAVSCPFSIEGGCDQPPFRVMTYVRVRHDEAGRLTEWALAQRTEELQGGAWSERGRETNETYYTYDARGRLRERRGWAGTTRFLYEGERLVRVDGGADSPSYRALERDGAGRVTRLGHVSCTPSGKCHATEENRYAYDGGGRLVRAERRDPSGGSMPWVEEWAYAGGRVVRRTRTSARVGGEEVRFVEYGYDPRGHLTSVTWDGRLYETRRYEGACDAVVTGPPEPSVEAEVGARPCHVSPGWVLNRCTEP